MPAIVMLQERKLSSTHAEMMRYIASELPCLATGKNIAPMVTDDEKGFEVIDEYLPKIHQLLCWNHAHLHLLDQLKTNWSQPFLHYFMNDLHNKILVFYLFLCIGSAWYR